MLVLDKYLYVALYEALYDPPLLDTDIYDKAKDAQQELQQLYAESSNIPSSNEVQVTKRDVDYLALVMELETRLDEVCS